MLALAEYRAASADLAQLGRRYEDLISQAIDGIENRQQAVQIVREIVPDYVSDYRSLLGTTMYQTAENAINYYEDKLGTEVDVRAMAERIANQQLNDRYYGSTLTQRLNVAQRILNRRITRSAQLGIPYLAGVLTQSYPFGAQINQDRRILLGTMAKIEQDVAKEMADIAGVRLIRWTLSHRHSKPDVCDDLANAINPSVVSYMRENNIKVNPKGLYLVDELPPPPHPNCQCEYMMIVNGRAQQATPVRRAVSAVRRLIRRIRRK